MITRSLAQRAVRAAWSESLLQRSQRAATQSRLNLPNLSSSLAQPESDCKIFIRNCGRREKKYGTFLCWCLLSPSCLSLSNILQLLLLYKRCQYSLAAPLTNLTAMTNWRDMLDVCQEQIFWECLRYLKYSSQFCSYYLFRFYPSFPL